MGMWDVSHDQFEGCLFGGGIRPSIEGELGQG
jgi:hypothetical protein